MLDQKDSYTGLVYCISLSIQRRSFNSRFPESRADMHEFDNLTDLSCF